MGAREREKKRETGKEERDEESGREGTQRAKRWREGSKWKVNTDKKNRSDNGK